MNYKDYIANENQLYGVREFRLDNDLHQKLLYVYNASGLTLIVNQSRNCDISEVKVRGNNISYLSSVDYDFPNKETHPSNFLSSFLGGFLTTAGLVNIGSESTYNGKNYYLHGNISKLPTRKSNFFITEEEIIIESETHEAAALSYDLLLKREVRIGKFKNYILISDKVKNLGNESEIHNILYHFNFGYPFIDENTILNINSNSVKGRTEIANKTQEIVSFNKLLKPTDGYEERCFYHYFKEKPLIEVINQKQNLTMKMSFDNSTLTNFIEWKLMAKHNYVVGLEPCSNEIDGIAKLAKENKLKMIKPNEEIKYQILIEFN